MEKEIRNYICWENSSLVNKLTGAYASQENMCGQMLVVFSHAFFNH